MAISIDWSTKVISVPKDYMTLVQSSPTEIRELSINQFRLDLKDLEDNVDGIVNPDTHRHYPAITVGGVELAMVIEIINGYTVTFENGQYAVNLTGANSNIGDVVNVNQVSVRSGNSAGLITNSAIEYSSFSGGVWVDTSSEYSGTVWPVGTPRQPVNNLSDALLIASYRGFTVFFILGDITLDDSLDFQQYSFYEESPNKSTITVASDAIVDRCEFYECTLTGTLDGNCKVKNCVIDDLNYISGYVELCVLQGVIQLGGGATAYFLDCWSGTDMGTPSAIDLGGSGQTLVMQNFNGYIKWQNKTGVEEANVSLNAGRIEIDSTVTNGSGTVIGVGVVTDNSGAGFTLDTTNLVSPTSVSNAVWAHSDAEFLLKIIKNKKSLVKNGSIWQLNIYDDDDSTPILTKDLKDKDGNNITDLEAGVLAQELRSSV